MAEATKSLNASAPIRVLHLIDGLGRGGSERWVWDIVRLSPAEHLTHRVVPIVPDKGDYVYGAKLQGAGVYSDCQNSPILGFFRKTINRKSLRARLGPIRRMLGHGWHFGIQIPAIKRIHGVIREFKPHVIHAHTFCGLTSGLVIKAYFNLPLIHTVPCLFSQMEDAGYSWMPKLYAWQHSRVDCFFTGASLRELRSVGVPSTKTFEIRGAVDCEAINIASADREHHYRQIRQSLGLSNDAIIALSVGRLHPSKGHLYALEAIPFLLQRLAHLHWVVLGEGDQRAALEARAKEFGIEKRVHLIGFHSDPLPYYAAADAYLRTNVFEAENLCSYQAMAMGLPVIGFDTGCETELVHKVGHGILVPNRDTQALAKATAEVLMMPDRGRNLGSLGASYSRAHLDIRQAIDTFAAAYTALAKGRGFTQ